MVAAFDREKAAFLASLPDLLQRCVGQFVAVHRGEVVDADVSRVALVRRFFSDSATCPSTSGTWGHLALSRAR